MVQLCWTSLTTSLKVQCLAYDLAIIFQGIYPRNENICTKQLVKEWSQKFYSYELKAGNPLSEQ